MHHSAHWRILSAALTALTLIACSSDNTGSTDDDTSTGGPARPGFDGTSGDVSEPTPDVVTPEEDVTTEDDGSTETDGSAEEPECTRAQDCPPRFQCIEGTCLRACTQDVQCDDLNPCTSESCADGFCEYRNIQPVVPDLSPGDCLSTQCVDGVLTEVNDEDDSFEDDGIACTVERCQGRFPSRQLDHSLCDDGDDLNGFELCSEEEGGCIAGQQPPWVCEEFVSGYLREEVCGDGQDNNGDGEADENCPCAFGTTQRCFTGPPGAREVGGCLDGVQFCINRTDPQWGPCTGSIVPSEEICDNKDNDCNGCVDDIEECVPLFACPDADTASPLRTYPLDGLALFDATPDGATWEWTVIAPPNSATTGAEDPDAAQTEVYFDVSGQYQISLTVEDEKGAVYGCSWVVTVAGSGLRVEMRWDTFGRVDMDLHMHRPDRTTDFCTDDDCYYANCINRSLSWGYPESPGIECGRPGLTCNNPRLDIDNISRFDPENINIDNPRNGDTFRIMAHKFSGSAPTNPVISIYCGGTLASVLGEAPDLATMRDSGGGCQGDTWRVADVTMFVDDATGITTCTVDVLEDETGDWDIRNDDRSF